MDAVIVPAAHEALLRDNMEPHFAPTASAWAGALIVAQYVTRLVMPEALPKLPSGQRRRALDRLTPERQQRIAHDEAALLRLLGRVSVCSSAPVAGMQ